MMIWKTSLYNLKSKPLYTILNIFSLSLSILLLLGIRQLKISFEHQVAHNLGNIDLVIGAKGSPLQLVLASVLHLDNPIGNILYEEAKKISKNPMVKTAVPISYGDHYKGYRIVGTTNDFMTLYDAKLERGQKVDNVLEVIIGSAVAAELQLDIGDTFLSSHGLTEHSIEVHAEKFTVVGILKPTRKVIDHLIITDLESIWDIHHHENEMMDEHKEHGHEEEHKKEFDTAAHEEKEITSLLVSFRNPVAFLNLPRRINEETNMQAVLPKYELNKLYNYLSLGIDTIAVIAYLILMISVMTIFISLYKMVKERSFDLALLRTYGASNFQLIQMILFEGLIIVMIAFTIGVLVLKIGANVVFELLGQKDKIHMFVTLPFQEILQIGVVVVILIILTVLLAIIPIIKMNISTILNNEK